MNAISRTSSAVSSLGNVASSSPSWTDEHRDFRSFVHVSTNTCSRKERTMIRRATIAAVILLAVVVMPAVAAEPAWYAPMMAMQKHASREVGALEACPTATADGMTVLGKACAHAHAQTLQTIYSELATRAEDAQKGSPCMRPLKKVDSASLLAMDRALSFATRPPKWSGPNGSAREAITSAQIGMTTALTAVVVCVGNHL